MTLICAVRDTGFVIIFLICSFNTIKACVSTKIQLSKLGYVLTAYHSVNWLKTQSCWGVIVVQTNSVRDLFVIAFQIRAQFAAIGLENKQWQATILPPFTPNWLSISYLSSCALSLTTGSMAALTSMDWLENPFLPLVTLTSHPCLTMLTQLDGCPTSPKGCEQTSPFMDV